MYQKKLNKKLNEIDVLLTQTRIYQLRKYLREMALEQSAKGERPVILYRESL